jgi:hypothetical protein
MTSRASDFSFTLPSTVTFFILSRKSLIFNQPTSRLRYSFRDSEFSAHLANPNSDSFAYLASGNEDQESLYLGYSVALASDVVDDNFYFLVFFHGR